MIRIVCTEFDYAAHAHIEGAKPITRYRTFDIEAPELEAWLVAEKGTRERPGYVDRYINGVEVLPS